MGFLDFLFKKEPNVSPHVIETIQRQVTILTESADLVNNSQNLDVVIHRLNMVLSSINILKKYSDREFKAAGYYLNGSLINTAKSIIDHRTQLINQAIEREIRSKIEPMRTTTGKRNKLEGLYNSMRQMPDLTSENLTFLDEIYTTIENELNNSKNSKDMRNFENIQQEIDPIEDISLEIKYERSLSPHVKLMQKNRTENFDLKTEYVKISTSGDENVCPMCAQFEGMIFAATDAPKLPLCPSCGCAYIHYLKEDLPPDAKTNSTSDFVLPADCAPMIYSIQQKIYNENDKNKCIRLCRRQLKALNEFMQPYISAGFPSPDELACRDLLPDLYMQLGKWEDAKNTIQACIEAKAYYPENGSDALTRLERYKRVAAETLSHISNKPGCLQSGIYKAMGYENEDKECLRDFLCSSTLIRKVKHKSTYELYCTEDNS